MSEAALLQEYEEKAQQLRAECDSLRESGAIPPDAPWRAALDAVRDAARLVEENALAPVKIGVVGEFSAGKTLLLGSLIGFADALPVSELPTTGNVTALNFTLVEELVTTRVGPYHIRFLDHAGFRECLGYLLEQARKRAKQAELRDELYDQLKAITADHGAVISQIEAWARVAWGASINPSLRFLIREMVAFVRAYAKCGAGLCDGGDAFEVESEAARRGLELPQVKEGIQTIPFEQLPGPAASISTRPERLTSEQIQDAFPLIRLVSVDVAVSRQVWDFSSLTGANRFSLMDFPGLGSDASGVRDLFLCLRELEKIQTILILLNGRRPGGSEGSRLYDLLQSHRPGEDIRDMILVAVGRFDELPLKNEGGEDKLRQLAGVPAPVKPAAATVAKSAHGAFGDDEEEAPAPVSAANAKLTEAVLLKELPVLGTCVAGATSIVPPGRRDRIVLVSPLLHLRFLEEKNPGIEVGSDEFLGGNREAAETAAGVAAVWKGVATRLREATPSVRPEPGLTRWLEDFATDGGIGQLRTLIQSHVQSHGLAQRLKDVRKDVESLRNALRTLLAATPAAPPRDTRTSADKLQAAEKELRHLVEVYQKATQKLEAPRFTVRQNDTQLTLEEALHEEIVYRVCEWPEWDSLWQNAKHGYITEPTEHDKDVFRDDDSDAAESSDSFPTRSEHFFEPFARTLEGLTGFTRKLIDDGVNEWLAGFREPTAPARLTLGTALERKTLPAEIKALRLGDRATGLASALRAAIDPPRLKKLLFPPDGNLAELETTQPNPAHAFPLARAGKESAGRVFAWAREMTTVPDDSRPERRHAHQAMVLRIRDEIIDVIRLEMAQLLSQSIKIAVDKFAHNLRVMTEKLSLAAANRFLLDAILRDTATGDSATAADAGDIVARVRRLAATPI